MDKLVNSLDLYIEARQSFTPYATDRVNEKCEYCRRIVEQMLRELFNKEATDLEVIDCPLLQAIIACIEKDVWNKAKKKSWFADTIGGLKGIASTVAAKSDKNQAKEDFVFVNLLDAVVLVKVLGSLSQAEYNITLTSLIANEREDISYLFSCYYPENPGKSLDELRKDLDQVNHYWCTFVDTTWEERRREEKQKREEAERRYGYVVEAEKARANVLREIAQKSQERTEYWHQTQQQVLRPQLENIQRKLQEAYGLIDECRKHIDNELVIHFAKSVFDTYKKLCNTNNRYRAEAIEKDNKELLEIINDYENYTLALMEILADFGVCENVSEEGIPFEQRLHIVKEQTQFDPRNAIIKRSLVPGLLYDTAQEGVQIVIEKEVVEVASRDEQVGMEHSVDEFVE